MFFWRTRDGQEVDLLIETNGKLLPVEVKVTATPTSVHVRNLQRLRTLMRDVPLTPLLVGVYGEEANPHGARFRGVALGRSRVGVRTTNRFVLTG